MTMVTNIRHFLDENDEVPELTPEANELLSFLAAIVEAATTAYDRPVTMANVKCRNISDGNLCLGEVEGFVYADNNQIGWECLECGDDGIITNWEHTTWDCRNYVRH